MVMVAGGERGSRASAGTVSLRPWPFHSYPSPAASVTVVLATMSAPLMGAGGGGRERGRDGMVCIFHYSKSKTSYFLWERKT